MYFEIMTASHTPCPLINWTLWTSFLTNPNIRNFCSKLTFSRLAHLSFLFLEVAPNVTNICDTEEDTKRRRENTLDHPVFFSIRDYLLGILKSCQDTSGPAINPREINTLVCWCLLFKIHAPLQAFIVKTWYFVASITWFPAFINHMVNIFWQCQCQPVS